MDAAVDALQADLPRISDAAKSMCSVLAASEITRADETTPPHELPHLLTIAKVVLKRINAHELPPPDKWAERHPQGAEESGADRIDAITRFKACAAIRFKAAGAGAKVTKLCGRAFLRATYCWEDGVAEGARSELQGVPAHTVDAFLDGWGHAIAGDGDDADLVWAADFNKALEARRAARREEVAERRQVPSLGASDPPEWPQWPQSAVVTQTRSVGSLARARSASRRATARRTPSGRPSRRRRRLRTTR